jgi:hypothetical protein
LTIRLKGSDKNLPGLYIQNQDGELVKKGSWFINEWIKYYTTTWS